MGQQRSSLEAATARYYLQQQQEQQQWQASQRQECRLTAGAAPAGLRSSSGMAATRAAPPSSLAAAAQPRSGMAAAVFLARPVLHPMMRNGNASEQLGASWPYVCNPRWWAADWRRMTCRGPRASGRPGLAMCGGRRPTQQAQGTPATTCNRSTGTICEYPADWRCETMCMRQLRELSTTFRSVSASPENSRAWCPHHKSTDLSVLCSNETLNAHQAITFQLFTPARL